MTNQLEIVTSPQAAAKPMPSALQILEGAIAGGITKENVEVVAQLRAMVKDERDEQAKLAFGRALFQLKKNMPEIYCDKAGKDKNGNITFRYCSEEEISKMLEPHLMAHGFVTLFGQEKQGDLVTVSITLIHEAGHQETRSYTVHTGIGNSVKDATMVDTSAGTSAWRHLVQKMFGLKSRLRDEDDPRNLGENITQAQADELEHRLKMVNGNVADFLATAQVTKFADIKTANLPIMEGLLRRKEGRK